jgi:hypothetical protein
MKNFALSALAGVGAVLAMASPAMAADNTFDLSAGRASAYGTYDRMMSIPERPVPPVKVQGTLAMNGRNRCGVVQIAFNGPADGIEWRTLAGLCTPGKTNYTATSELLWGGAEPALRVCTGTTVRRAEQGRVCDVHSPATSS